MGAVDTNRFSNAKRRVHMDFDKAANLIDRLKTLTTEYDSVSGRVAQLTADISEARAELTDAIGMTTTRGVVVRERRPISQVKAAVAAVAAAGPIRAEDVSHLFKSPRSAGMRLAQLAKQGFLQRVGTGLYQVNGAQH